MHQSEYVLLPPLLAGVGCLAFLTCLGFVLFKARCRTLRVASPLLHIGLVWVCVKSLNQQSIINWFQGRFEPFQYVLFPIIIGIFTLLGLLFLHKTEKHIENPVFPAPLYRVFLPVSMFGAIFVATTNALVLHHGMVYDSFTSVIIDSYLLYFHLSRVLLIVLLILFVILWIRTICNIKPKG